MQEVNPIKIMSINFKFIASLALTELTTIHAPFAQAGFFDELKTAVADGLDTPKQNLNAYASVEDKQLVDAFYFISDDGAEQGVARDIFAVRKYKFVKITFGSLTFSDLFKKQSMVSIVRDMESYSFSPLDIFGKKYVALANARGNQISNTVPN